MDGPALRMSTNYGYAPGVRFNLVVNHFVFRALTGRPLTVYGDGSNWRPFVHVADAARACATVPGLPLPFAGYLGASLFGVRSVWKTATSTKVPQSFTPFQVVLARLFVGSVSAIVLYLGLSAGIVQVANVSGTSATVLLTVAFAAGYSERFAPQAIERVSQLSGGEASPSSKRGG